jgi:hypothetical protein
MTISINIDFLGRECKTNNHNDCVGRWLGLGFEISCYCNCHVKKEKMVRDWSICNKQHQHNDTSYTCSRGETIA